MQRAVDRAIGDAEGALTEDGRQLVAPQFGARRQHTAQLGPSLHLAIVLIIGHYRLRPLSGPLTTTLGMATVTRLVDI